MTESNGTIGRVKAVLVFGREPSTQAVISHVIARRLESRGHVRVRFSGTVQFSHAAKRHIRSTIVPIVDRILSGLQLPSYDFELSAVNLGAASALDVGMTISGFSADVAILAALLSAGLQIPIVDDSVVTGHIASGDGDIRVVKSLAAKVRAVEADGAVSHFLYPDLDQDQSLQTLSPAERQRAITAVMGVRDSLRTRAVRGIDEVIRALFTHANIVLASLKEGFFTAVVACQSDNPVARTIGLLAQDNSGRFWRVLQQCLFAGDNDRSKRLLEALVDFRIVRESYDSGLGAKLLDLLRCVPPAVRRLQIKFPLVDTARCLKLGAFAAPADHQDVLMLLDAVHGKGLAATPEAPVAEPATAAASEADYAAFDAVVAQISEKAIARDLGVPLDSARGSFILDSSTVQSPDEFHEVLDAFYIHLHCWISCRTGESLDAGRVRTEAIKLLETAFRNQGGEQAAYARARDGIQGGMRSVLDTIAEQCKRDRYTAHVQRTLCEAISAMDWDDRVAFMQAAMRRLGPFLPPELSDEPPERFVRQYEVIVQTYVESLDKLSQLFRTL